MLPDPADIRLLTQVGFLAAGHGDAPRALHIFDALAVLRPNRAFAFVGLACALMNAGRAAEAVQRLQALHLPEGPERDMLHAFQALALQLAGRASESTQLLRQIAARVPQEPPSDGAQLAARMLGQNPGAMSPAASPSIPS
ncbi:MAG: hypothetical protein ABWY08_11960 [Comamonas sp.]